MSGEEDLCGGSDPGSVAYLQTCSSNTSGQVISYTLIRRDDLISPIRERQSYDSEGLDCQFHTANWTKLEHPSRISADQAHRFIFCGASHWIQAHRAVNLLANTLSKLLDFLLGIILVSAFPLSWVKPKPTKLNVCLPGHLFALEIVLSVKSNYPVRASARTSQVSTGVWKWPNSSPKRRARGAERECTW